MKGRSVDCRLCTLSHGGNANVTVNPRLLCYRHQPVVDALPLRVTDQRAAAANEAARAGDGGD